jgi:hypothetical protein
VSRCPETPGAKYDYWLHEVGNTGQAKNETEQRKAELDGIYDRRIQIVMLHGFGAH